MSNEIRIGYSWQIANGNYQDQLAGNLSLTQTTQGAAAGVMAVPTTAGGTVLPLGSVSTPGWIYMQNLDGTNYVQFGPTSGGAIVVCGKMKAGEIAIFRADSGVTLRLIANTATCNVQYELLQD